MTETGIAVRESVRGWEATVSFGVDTSTGKRIRKHVRAKTRDQLDMKIDVIIASPPNSSEPVPTVAAWLRLWLGVLHTTAAHTTVTKNTWAVERWIIPAMGKVRLDQLTPMIIEKRIAGMTAKNRKGQAEVPSASTKWEVYSVLRTALNFAVKKQRIPSNPAINAVVPQPPRPEVAPLTESERTLILPLVNEHPDRARWLFSLLLGLRQSEALGLTWEDIDFEKGVVSVSVQLASPGERAATNTIRKRLKTAASRRTLPIPALLLAALRDLQAETGLTTGLVFRAPDGGCVDQRADARKWERLVKKAGITRRVRGHDMRHTTATALLEAGVPDRATQEVLGWASTAMAQRYQHPSSLVVDDAVRRGVSILLGDNGGPNDVTVTVDEGRVRAWLAEHERMDGSVTAEELLARASVLFRELLVTS